METTLARKARLQMRYQGVELASHCVSVVYTDHAHDLLDELDVCLEDRDLLWQGPRFPGRGDRIEAKIQCFDWYTPGRHLELDCGVFEIDEVELNGSPDMVSIKARSARLTTNARTEKWKKGMEKISLSAIAANVAANAGLSLAWQGNEHVYPRVEQREEGDLPFLKRLCKDRGNCVKVSHGELIVFAGATWDSRPPVGTLARGKNWIKSYRFRASGHDRYKACVVQYWNREKKETYVGRFDDPASAGTGEVLMVNHPVESVEEAQVLARNRLRDKNRLALTADFTLVGDPGRRAGYVVQVVGFGRFDGRFFMERTSHRLDSRGGYTTDLFLRRALDY